MIDPTPLRTIFVVGVLLALAAGLLIGWLL